MIEESVETAKQDLPRHAMNLQAGKRPYSPDEWALAQQQTHSV
jgi:hypothetical protein